MRGAPRGAPPPTRGVPWARSCRAAVSALCAAAALCAGAQAQGQVRFRGAGDPDFDALLLRFVAEGGYTLVSTDTTLANGDTLVGPVLVLRARLSIAGAVTGDLFAVDANVFARPTARVDGEVWNLGGGFYPSDLADIAGPVHDHPLAPYRVEREGDLYVIVGLAHASAFRPDGLYGLGLPTYDRVDGVSVPVGASWLLPALGRVRPSVGGRAVYRSERGAWDGGGFVELARGRTRLRVGAERATRTADGWIRGDVANSLAFLVVGNDLRDYYQSDRYWARLELDRSPGAWLVTPFLQAQREDARRLRAGDPWTLLDADSIRPNRPVVAAAVLSGILGLEAEWEGAVSAFDLAAQVEVGAPTETGPIACAAGTCPALDTAAVRALFDGEETFTRVSVDGSWESPALFDHRLRARWHLQGPVGGEALPLRRWSHVGGPGTLPTLGEAERQGDRVVFVETGYGFPLRFEVPLFGVPELELVHIFGGAWAEGGDDSLDQNVGLRLRSSLGWVRVTTDPADFGDDVVVDFGAELPF